MNMISRLALVAFILGALVVGTCVIKVGGVDTFPVLVMLACALSFVFLGATDD